MKKIKALLVLVLAFFLVACGQSSGSTEESVTDSELGSKVGETVELSALASATPHAEILKFIEEDLEIEGIKINIVSEVWDSTWNEQVQNGQVDFHYDAYQPYLDEWNQAQGGNLTGAGKVHVEPIVMKSEIINNLEDLAEGANIAIKEDVTNQYRALKLLEQAGLIKLSNDINLSNADVSYIEENEKNLEIVALDADVIMNTRQDFTAYITNTNRILEAGLDPTEFLAREDTEDSIFANVIAVKEENVDDPSIKKIVELLQTDKVAKFIEDKYEGAVLPAFN